MTIDLNADVGEGMDSDAELLSLTSSANIACGAHAGSPAIIRASVRSALSLGVAIGAHPGFADRENFGRRALLMTREAVRALVVAQVRLVRDITRAEGGVLAHVKPHGALYNMAASDADLANAISEAVRDVDPVLVLVGLADSEMTRAGARAGLRTASEAFADRRYLPDGLLVPRGIAGAVIENVAESVEQATLLVLEHRAKSLDGRDVRIRADTMCLHGDGPNAVTMARAIRQALEARGVGIAPLVPTRARS